jgi:hypothetical protein
VGNKPLRSETGQGGTRGFAKGISHDICEIINRAFGFCNFDSLRGQILVEGGGT